MSFVAGLTGTQRMSAIEYVGVALMLAGTLAYYVLAIWFVLGPLDRGVCRLLRLQHSNRPSWERHFVEWLERRRPSPEPTK